MSHHSNGPIKNAEASPSQARQWSGLDLLLISVSILVLFCLLFLALLVTFIATGIIPSGSSTTLVFSAPFSIALATAQCLAMFLSIVLFALRRKGPGWYTFGFRPFAHRWIWISLGLLVGVLVLTRLSMAGLLLLAPPSPGTQNVNAAFPSPSLTFIVVFLLLGGIAAPLLEEAFFRGILYPFLRERWGFWMGVLASSLIFSIVHLDVYGSIGRLLLGVVAAFVYERSNSLWPSSIIHLGNNMVTLLLFYLSLADLTKIPLW